MKKEDLSRQDQWDTLMENFGQKVVDGLGHPIDHGILETVVALNALDIHTSASCEGHIDWGEAGPWVDIEPVQTDAIRNLYKQRSASIERAKSKESTRNDSGNLGNDWDEVYKLNSQISATCVELIRGLLVLLDEFYINRVSSAERRLILHRFGLDVIRVESQGLMAQEFNPLDMKRNKLVEYQDEMRDFTVFLKSKYFDS